MLLFVFFLSCGVVVVCVFVPLLCQSRCQTVIVLVCFVCFLQDAVGYVVNLRHMWDFNRKLEGNHPGSCLGRSLFGKSNQAHLRHSHMQPKRGLGYLGWVTFFSGFMF